METVTPAKPDPISVLAGLITSGKTREQRLMTLLRSPENGDATWFMHVPKCFNDALDIRRTVRVGAASLVWTQGANFSFSAGDTIYDTPAAWNNWSEALQRIKCCVQVAKSISVSPPSAGASRSAGSVTFTYLKPNELRTALATVRTRTVTQDEFVRFLIAGFPDELPLD